MKPILAIVHVYYPEIWPELEECLLNITVPYELYVTTNEQNKDIQNNVLKLKKDAHFEVVENRGYDVGPFMQIINKINLDNYSYVIKLHTKRNLPPKATLNGYDVSGKKWREYSLSFLRGEYFSKCLDAFEKDPKLGMTGNFHLITSKEKFDQKAKEKAKILLKRCKLNLIKYQFIAGTMFMCRAKLLKPLKKLDLCVNNFGRPEKNRGGSLAHAIERALGEVIYSQGFYIEDVFTSRKCRQKEKIRLCIRRICRFIFMARINSRGILRVKICKIPIPVGMFFRRPK